VGVEVGTEKGRAQAATMPWAYLRLPPFPQVAIRVLQMAKDENMQWHRLCDLISSDPAFASEVLTVANSVLYAPRYPATSILQAVAVMGASTLQGMCITVGVRSYLGKTLSYPAMRNLWRHNLACAIVAQRLAQAGPLDRDTAYTAGILHDVGRMGLAVIQPDAYSALLDKHRGTSESMLAAERELFGWDHCETGKQLVSDWMMPEQLEAAVSRHHEQCRADGTWDITELIKVSCHIASSLGFAAFPGCETMPIGELLSGLPTGEHGPFALEAGILKKEIDDAIHAVESV
jgi:putative nucleotidyltransferase with HDIG domain